MSTPLQLAGTCVAIERAGEWVGVLLRGPSGSGKSDLALRLIDGGARLVADDLVIVTERGGRVIARAPLTIRGRMEVRGVGVVEVQSLDEVALCLVIDLAGAAAVPRLPEPAFVAIGNTSLPLLMLNPFENSVVAKIRVSVQALRRNSERGVTFPFAYG